MLPHMLKFLGLARDIAKLQKLEAVAFLRTLDEDMPKDTLMMSLDTPA